MPLPLSKQRTYPGKTSDTPNPRLEKAVSSRVDLAEAFWSDQKSHSLTGIEPACASETLLDESAYSETETEVATSVGSFSQEEHPNRKASQLLSVETLNGNGKRRREDSLPGPDKSQVRSEVPTVALHEYDLPSERVPSTHISLKLELNDPDGKQELSSALLPCRPASNFVTFEFVQSLYTRAEASFNKPLSGADPDRSSPLSNQDRFEAGAIPFWTIAMIDSLFKALRGMLRGPHGDELMAMFSATETNLQKESIRLRDAGAISNGLHRLCLSRYASWCWRAINWLERGDDAFTRESKEVIQVLCYARGQSKDRLAENPAAHSFHKSIVAGNILFMLDEAGPVPIRHHINGQPSYSSLLEEMLHSSEVVKAIRWRQGYDDEASDSSQG